MLNFCYRPAARVGSVAACVWLMLMVALPAQAVPASSNTTSSAPARRILFVGNSFTYGGHSPVWHYRAGSVTDLNGKGVGGVPALFKLFTQEAGLNYSVSLETVGGKSLKYHYDNERGLINRPWDDVILQEYSTLDPTKPGDPAQYRLYAGKLASLFDAKNPKVSIWLMASWARPDQTYKPKGHWYGQSIYAMADDLQTAAEQIAQSNPHIEGVVPVGEAFSLAIRRGVADPNPYDGLSFDQIDLWTYDHYHASAWGYYLEALMDLQRVTGVDPRSLGKNETAAAELGISHSQATALQAIAYAQATATRQVPRAAPPPAKKSANATQPDADTKADTKSKPSDHS